MAETNDRKTIIQSVLSLKAEPFNAARLRREPADEREQHGAEKGKEGQNRDSFLRTL